MLFLVLALSVSALGWRTERSAPLQVFDRLMRLTEGLGEKFMRTAATACEVYSDRLYQKPLAQLVSKGDVAKYGATFVATGCPNKNPDFNWWKTITDASAWNDMYQFCKVTMDGSAVSSQVDNCCGKGKTCRPTSCTKQTAWTFPTSNIIGLRLTSTAKECLEYCFEQKDNGCKAWQWLGIGIEECYLLKSYRTVTKEEHNGPLTDYISGVVPGTEAVLKDLCPGRLKAIEDENKQKNIQQPCGITSNLDWYHHDLAEFKGVSSAKECQKKAGLFDVADANPNVASDTALWLDTWRQSPLLDDKYWPASAPKSDQDQIRKALPKVRGWTLNGNHCYLKYSTYGRKDGYATASKDDRLGFLCPQTCANILIKDFEFANEKTKYLTDKPEKLDEILAVSLDNCDGDGAHEIGIAIGKTKETTQTSENHIGWDKSLTEVFTREWSVEATVHAEMEIGGSPWGASVKGGWEVTAAGGNTNTDEKSSSKNGLDVKIKAKMESETRTADYKAAPMHYVDVVWKIYKQQTEVPYTATAQCIDAHGNAAETKTISGKWTGIKFMSSTLQTKDRSSEKCEKAQSCQCAGVTNHVNRGGGGKGCTRKGLVGLGKSWCYVYAGACPENSVKPLNDCGFWNINTRATCADDKGVDNAFVRSWAPDECGNKRWNPFSRATTPKPASEPASESTSEPASTTKKGWFPKLG